jgi:hypothetical protein
MLFSFWLADSAILLIHSNLSITVTTILPLYNNLSINHSHHRPAHKQQSMYQSQSPASCRCRNQSITFFALLPPRKVTQPQSQPNPPPPPQQPIKHSVRHPANSLHYPVGEKLYKSQCLSSYPHNKQLIICSFRHTAPHINQ